MLGPRKSCARWCHRAKPGRVSRLATLLPPDRSRQDKWSQQRENLKGIPAPASAENCFKSPCKTISKIASPFPAWCCVIQVMQEGSQWGGVYLSRGLCGEWQGGNSDPNGDLVGNIALGPRILKDEGDSGSGRGTARSCITEAEYGTGCSVRPPGSDSLRRLLMKKIWSLIVTASFAGALVGCSQPAPPAPPAPPAASHSAPAAHESAPSAEALPANPGAPAEAAPAAPAEAAPAAPAEAAPAAPAETPAAPAEEKKPEEKKE